MKSLIATTRENPVQKEIQIISYLPPQPKRQLPPIRIPTQRMILPLLSLLFFINLT